jgi:hypothetical protein
MTATLVLLATTALGLTAGAVLAEGAVLVPFWRSLPPRSFLAWYREHGALLLRFFGPLEVVSTVLVIVAAVASWRDAVPGASFLVVASGLCLLVLGSFPLYFQRVNASFKAGTIEIDRVAGELRRWARWHWARVALTAAAFVAAALAASVP